jgi:hypothetical protein
MHIIEAIVWGLLWEFPVTCILAVPLGGVGGYLWGTWGAVIGLAAAIGAGSMLDVALWRIVAWQRHDPRRQASPWQAGAALLVVLAIALAVVYATA